MIFNKIDSFQKKELSFLIGKKILQIFTQGGGIILSNPVELSSGNDFFFYFQAKYNDSYFLKIFFDQKLFSMKKSEKFNLEVEKINFPKIDFNKYHCAISFRETFSLKSIKIFNWLLERDPNPSICYLHSLVFVAESGDFIIVSKDESPHSFTIKYNDNSFLEKLLNNSFEVDHINKNQ